MKLIAFGYQSRVGKDACVRAIMKEAKKIPVESGMVRLMKTKGLAGVSRHAFARKLKAVAFDLFGQYGLQQGSAYEAGFHAEKDRDKPLPKIGKTPVEVWIEVGNKMREVMPTIWVDYVMAHMNPKDLNLISDLRFPNEMKAVHEAGGWCVLVTRPGNPVKGSDQFLTPDSEWDQRIENTGSLEDLGRLALWVVQKYLGA